MRLTQAEIEALYRSTDTTALESALLTEIKALQAERDKLVEALEGILSGQACLPGYSISDAISEARAVLQSVRGGK